MNLAREMLKNEHLINDAFYQFINQDVLPLAGLNQDKFWLDFLQLLEDLEPKNKELLMVRDKMQQQIDDWHQTHPNFNLNEYQAFLKQIGYLSQPIPDFKITTENIDDEIAQISGPQLVVPITNARFALNAANARWVSLYDSLYGSDVISELDGLSRCKQYNPARGKYVIHIAKDFLDEHFPLEHGSHHDVKCYNVYYHHLLAFFPDGTQSGLDKPCQFVASSNPDIEPTSIVLKNNNLHIELILNRKGKIGQSDLSGLDDIQIESAISTIMDFEDSVAAVDSQDKLVGYKNWLGLITGNLTASIQQGNKSQIRRLNCDKHFAHKNGEDYRLHGRSLLLVRNVGHLMKTDLIQTKQSDEGVPEGIVDAVITALIASIEIKNPKACRLTNSRTRSIYIVKPKMHGPDEVAFSCEIFDRVEKMLDLAPNTIKIGIMDEERRTSVNLKQCIYAARERIMFINTGFLDRTGDEIHTSMKAGPFMPKDKLKQQPWIDAYEKQNVALGLLCGFSGKAQIGKGMWAKPDNLNEMLQDKIAHPQSGASTAWVPSPTAACLHALHYHQIDVIQRQAHLQGGAYQDKTPQMLTVALQQETLTPTQITTELRNNIQGILGYVSRWVGMGVGCSKVPDIENTALMEDRATLRISSQHIANWLEHNICTKEEVESILAQMASVVDKQNQDVEGYQTMTENNLNQSFAFQAARDLIFKGSVQPNGYTEPLLHYYREKEKVSLVK